MRLLAAMTISLACSAANAADIDVRSIIVPAKIKGGGVIDQPDQEAYLGKPYNVFTGELLAETPCLVPGADSPKVPTPDQFKGIGQDYYFNDTLKNLNSLTRSSKSDTSVNFVYKMIEAKFGEGSQSDNYFNSVDSFGRFYRRIITWTHSRDGGNWSKIAEDLLKARNISGFVNRCATHYVRAVKYGHSISATLHFSLRETKQSRSDSNNLSIGVKDLIGLGIESSADETKVSTLATMSAEGFNLGALAAPAIPKDDIGAVSNFFNFATYEYPKLVRESGSYGDILLLEIVPYTDRKTIPYVDRLPAWADLVFENIIDKSYIVQEFISALSELKYAYALGPNIAKLYANSLDDVQAKIKTAQDMRELFKAALKVCELIAKADSKPNDDAMKSCNDLIDAAITDIKVKELYLTRAS